MIYGFKKEYLGKRIWAYIPTKSGELEFRQGFIKSFIKAGAKSSIAEPMYLVKYDDIDIPHAAQPEWLVFEPATPAQ